MALLCRNCYADVTEDYHAERVKRKYRCKCGGSVFLDQQDDPKTPYEVNHNDRRFILRPFKIRDDE